MKNKITCIVTLFLCNNIFADIDSTYHILEKDRNNFVTFATFENNNNLAINETSTVEFLKVFNKEDKLIDYRLFIKQVLDELGYTHEQYQQYYNGQPVVGATYAIQIKDRNIKSLNGEFGDIKNVDIRPNLLENEIAQIAQVIYRRNNSIDDSQLKTQSHGLVWCRDITNKESDYQLAYKINIYSAQNPIESYYYYIDATKGKLLMTERINCYVNSPTNAFTMYSGAKDIVTDSYITSGITKYRIRELRQNVNIGTFSADYFYVTSPPVTSEFIDNDNNWTLAEHGFDQYAIDAHWGAEKIFDYWKTIHNRNSIDNLGLVIKSNVHFGASYNNAAWLGPPNNSVVYGDGDGIKYTSLTSLDVCAHEFGHGITQFVNGLQLTTAESGALNEGFSDIWGAVIENWAAPNSPPKNKWLCGEEIYLQFPFYTRNMSNPNLTPSPNAQPDTYLGTNWNSGGNSHINSGVLSYWFYLLTEGGCGTNDVNNNYFVRGIGIDRAAKIAYETEKLLASNANYNSCRTQSLLAAQTVYGNNSIEYYSVANAWYAVGVGSLISYPSNIQFTISGVSCINNCAPLQNSYTINNLPPNATVSWQVTPNNSSSFNSQIIGNTLNISRDCPSNLMLTINATITLCGISYPAVSKSINVGMPYVLFPYQGTTYPIALMYDINNENCNTTCYSPSQYSFYSVSDAYNGTVSWQKLSSYPANVAWSGYNNYVKVLLKAPNQTITLKRIITNPCNTGNPIEEVYCFMAGNTLCTSLKQTSIPPIAQQLKVYPNPASVNNALTLELTSNKGDVIDFENSSIQLVDAQNLIVVQKSGSKIAKEKLEIPALSNGVYYIKVINKHGVSSQQLIIKN
jgi:Zn-dependent metalloprotease